MAFNLDINVSAKDWVPPSSLPILYNLVYDYNPFGRANTFAGIS